MPKKCISETLKLMPATDAEGGMFLDQINEKLAEVVRAVDGQGKPGEMIIKLKFKRNMGAIQIDGDLVTKIPRTRPDSTMLWATNDGNLVVTNPAQRGLEFDHVQPRRTEMADSQPAAAPAPAAAIEIVKPTLVAIEPARPPVAAVGG